MTPEAGVVGYLLGILATGPLLQWMHGRFGLPLDVGGAILGPLFWPIGLLYIVTWFPNKFARDAGIRARERLGVLAAPAPAGNRCMYSYADGKCCTHAAKRDMAYCSIHMTGLGSWK